MLQLAENPTQGDLGLKGFVLSGGTWVRRARWSVLTGETRWGGHVRGTGRPWSFRCFRPAGTPSACRLPLPLGGQGFLGPPSGSVLPENPRDAGGLQGCGCPRPQGCGWFSPLNISSVFKAECVSLLARNVLLGMWVLSVKPFSSSAELSSQAGPPRSSPAKTAWLRDLRFPADPGCKAWRAQVKAQGSLVNH